MRARAFTIVELIIAIALFALVALIALPAGMSLLTREGARSGVFACESALRAARQDAMRENLIMEIGARQRDGRWELVVREFVVESRDDEHSVDRSAPLDADPFADADDEEPAWRVIATLPRDFAFAFEAKASPLETLDLPEIPDALADGDASSIRVALLLPNGAVDAVDSWRLVTAQKTDDERRLLLTVAYWSGAITATPETDDPLALPTMPEPPADDA